MRRQVGKHGNSGGIYLPVSWIGGLAEAKLVEGPRNPEKEILEAFSGQLQHVLGVFLYGSYARGEHEEDSDIDVMMVTDGCQRFNVSGRLKRRGYDIRAVSMDDALRMARSDPIFMSSVMEAKPLLNHKVLGDIRSVSPSGSSLRIRLDMARSSLGIMESLLEGLRNPGAETVYPLFMRLKEMLLAKCFLEGRAYSGDDLEELRMRSGISRQEFELMKKHYRAFRDGRKPPHSRPGPASLFRLASMLESLIEHVEKKEVKERNKVHRGAGRGPQEKER